MLSQLPTIEEAARRMRQKELTPLDLVEHCLGRIAQFEDRIHAWVLVDEEGARKEARRLTDMLARGEDLGPLHGMPIGIKDIIDVAGWQTKCGSRLRENVPPAEKDATVVANLRKAGAIILGKTVTTEFACFDPPPTRNPWNLDHTPGGSSSGSAAAVAMEMCMAALGTQTGGSIIRPAAYCGVCGFKPSFVAKVWGDGVMPLTMHMDHVGPICRSVPDLELLAKTIADLDDDLWFGTRDPGATFRFGICRSFFQEKAASDVWESFVDAIERLKGRDCHIVEMELPAGFEHVHRMHRRIMAAEAGAIHRSSFQQVGDQYSPHVAALIREGLELKAVDYAEALIHQRTYWLEYWCWVTSFENERMDAVLAPSTPSTAPLTNTTGDPLFNSPSSYSGTPAATIPIAIANGLAVGMQVQGFSNEDTLEAARFCEQVVGCNPRPPSLMEER